MAYALRRILLTLPLLLVISLVVFVVGESLPGDPAAARFDQHGGEEARAAWRARKGLDLPIHERYLRYIGGVVTRFDFGESYVDDRELGPDIVDKFAATAELSFAAMLLAVPVGLLMGIVSAVRRGRWEDYVGNLIAVGGISVPVFWLGMMLTLLAILMGFDTIGGRYDQREFNEVVSGYSTQFYFVESVLRGRWAVAASCLQYLLVPAVALSTIPMAVITRMTRSAMLEEVGKDYVRTAHAKGIAGRVVVMRHVLRNALIPVVTITGLQFGALLSGAVLTESIFDWPGLGRFILTGVQRNDSPVLVGGILLVATIFIVVNLVVDLLYGIVDPRVRAGGEG